MPSTSKVISVRLTKRAVKQKIKKTEKKDVPASDEAPASSTSSSVYDFVPVVETVAAKPKNEADKSVAVVSSPQHYPVPTARRSSSLAILDNRLYVFGGVREGESGRESVFGDLWTLDISRGGQQWNCLEAGLNVEWVGCDDEQDDDDDEKENGADEVTTETAAVKDVDDDDDAAVEDEADDIDEKDEAPVFADDADEKSPSANVSETLAEFFNRTKEHWMSAAVAETNKDTTITATDKLIRKRAFELCSATYQPT